MESRDGSMETVTWRRGKKNEGRDESDVAEGREERGEWMVT